MMTVDITNTPCTAIVAGLLICYCLSTWIYNLYYHPLADFPGPLLGRASLWWRFIHTSTGKIHLALADLHKQYGPIVRVSPNELSFGTVESWKAIYGHTDPIPQKAAYYDIFSAGLRSKCLGSERDERRHAAMHRMLAPAFATRALLDQEHIINRIIDRFVQIVGERAPPGSQGINMCKWYEMCAFDIMGEMAFGESFHSIEAGKPHFWGDLVLSHIYFITFVDNLARIGSIATLFRYLVPSSVLVQNRISRYAREQVERCLSSNTRRKDFVSLLVEKVHKCEVEKEEMAAHVSTFAIAGGETIASFLSATTFFLLQYPDKLERLVSEIRGAFPSYDDVNAQAAQHLPYLQGVINEGLRFCPPGSQGAPRVSPGFELHGRYIPKGVEISTSPWTTTHSAKYFKDPMKFIPERWLDPHSTDVKEASQPFLLGPRSCIGRNFAHLEMNLVMTKLLWRYDLELVNRSLDWFGEGRVYVFGGSLNLLFAFMSEIARLA
ncbi:cytochrome P450 [Aspergillus avenaceus]|uniref:Cytochrome P450 n=1 Tax=Aspergillus avenaceus TaxID=36643 RepID=A0A5N6TV27_ASPAV|nr:cytochrome P450 [Aspergillus avenaceus]